MKTLINSQWMVAIGLATAVCLLTSCSSSSTKEPQQQEDSAAELDEQTEVSEDDLVGRWVLDPEGTEEMTREKIKPAQVGGRQALNQYINSVTGSVMNFDLHADGSFDCYQTVEGASEEYTGDWLLDGDKIRFEQTHHFEIPETDLLTGTVDGQSMNLLHHQRQFTVPIVLQKQSE